MRSLTACKAGGFGSSGRPGAFLLRPLGPAGLPQVSRDAPYRTDGAGTGKARGAESTNGYVTSAAVTMSLNSQHCWKRSGGRAHVQVRASFAQALAPGDSQELIEDVGVVTGA